MTSLGERVVVTIIVFCVAFCAFTALSMRENHASPTVAPPTIDTTSSAMRIAASIDRLSARVDHLAERVTYVGDAIMYGRRECH